MPTETTKAAAKVAFGAAGAILAVIAAINLFSTFTPVAARNEKIYADLDGAQNLPPAKRLDTYNALAYAQAKALAQKPSEPYGWARLSYLRLAEGSDKQTAFAALRMSDLVSPYEAPQLPERAYTWRSFHDVETPAQQAYQDELWAKAYILEPGDTWEMAIQHGIAKEVAESLAARDMTLYGDWKIHMAEAGISDAPPPAAPPALPAAPQPAPLSASPPSAVAPTGPPAAAPPAIPVSPPAPKPASKSARAKHKPAASSKPEAEPDSDSDADMDSEPDPETP
ncbi:MAG: hypothetical protein P4M15_11670 [Alphaproteobacteria bacterium]|nr:hypothetical protein [Alphaproteobacteria bacterium]